MRRGPGLVARAEELARVHRDAVLAGLVADAAAWDLAVVEQAVIAAGADGREFSANDMRPLLPEQGRGLVGAAMRGLRQAGVLVHTGAYVPSTSPATKGHRLAVYRLAPEIVARLRAARHGESEAA